MRIATFKNYEIYPLSFCKMRLKNFFKSKKPNILMILIDGGGREDALSKVVFYQDLKKKSTFFSNLIPYAPYTIGAMNSLFSGMDGNSNGVNGYYQSHNFDKKNIFTLQQYLKNAGYYTELDFVIDEVVPVEGFDKIRIFQKDPNLDLARRHSEILNQIKGKQPFFLFLDYDKIALNLVSKVIKKYNDFSKEYFNNKESNLFHYIGWMKESGEYLRHILQELEKLGLDGNTLILIFSDHGCSVGDRMGERVYGVYLYEYTLKNFIYIIGKGMPKNKEIDNVISNIDIMPTLLDILNIKERTGYKTIQGKSFLPIIHGKNEDRIAYSETGGLGGPTPSPELHSMYCVRTIEWKLIYNRINGRKELYNIIKDKKEEDNLAGKGLEIEEKLWAELKKRMPNQ